MEDLEWSNVQVPGRREVERVDIGRLLFMIGLSS